MTNSRGSGGAAQKTQRPNDEGTAESSPTTDMSRLLGEAQDVVEEVIEGDNTLFVKGKANPNGPGPSNPGNVTDADKAKKDKEDKEKKKPKSPTKKRGAGTGTKATRNVVVRRVKSKYVTKSGKLKIGLIKSDIMKLAEKYLLRAETVSGAHPESVGVSSGLIIALNLLTDEIEVMPNQVDPEVDSEK